VTMKSSTRQVDGVTIVDLSGRITLGEGSVVLRDLVRDLLGKGLARAQEILSARRADLDAGARLLLERETVTADDFPAIRSAKAAAPQVTVAPV